MSNGPLVSPPIVPAGTLPVMSLQAESIFDEWIAEPPTPGIHPHPLRSNSVKSKFEKETSNSDRPDSFILPVYSLSNPGNDSYFQNAPQRPTTSYTGSEEGLRYATLHRSSHPDFPIVPTRPPLRPTPTFGGVSSMVSYYSNASIELEERSISIAIKEELQQRGQAPLSKRRLVGCLSTLCFLNLQYGIDVTSLATVLPSISHSLELSAVEAFWTINSFLLSVALIQPLSMRLSSAIGSRTVLLLGSLLWLGGSIACACAPTFSVLLLGRILGGIGSGTASTLITLVLHQIVGSGDDGKYERSTSLAFWLGALVGPIVGGACSQMLEWRYIFYIDTVCSGLGLLGILLMLKIPTWDGSLLQQLVRIDYLGWILITGSLTSILLAAATGGTLYPWISWQTLLPLAIGMSAFVLWTQYSRYRINTIIPVGMFSNLHTLVSCLGTVVHGILFTAFIYFAPLYSTMALDFNAIVASLAIAPMTFSLLITALIAGFLFKIPAGWWITCLGWCFATASIGCMIILTSTTSNVAFVPVSIAAGIALGLLCHNPGATIQCSASNDDETIYASSLTSFFQALGHTLGVAIGSCVFLNQLTHDSPVYATTAISAVYHDIFDGKDGIQARFLESYIDSLRTVWIVMCAFAGVALLLNLLSIRRRHRTRGSLTREERRMWVIL